MVNVRKLILVLYILANTSVASADLIAQLDFANNGSGWTILPTDTGLPLIFGKDGDPTKVGFQHPNTSSTGHYNLYQEISAPVGYTMSNVRVEALGSGFSSWIMDARIGMGNGPATNALYYNYYDYIGQRYNGQVVTNAPLLLDATGDDAFGGLTTLFVGLELVKGLPGVSQLVDLSNIKVYADLTPLPTDIPGAREPLTFRNSGLYGPWNAYFTNPDTPFDHAIVQAIAYEGDIQGHTDWNQHLQNSRNAGKRIIADVVPQVANGQGGYFGIANLTPTSPASDLDKLANAINEFLDTVDKNELYGITLGEEHIFWDGRVDHLNGIYDRVKAAHPDVPVFQWYSPSSIGTAPGISGWYNLKSDGWVSDEYYLDQPAMEKNMRAYVIQQKPITNVIWAGGDAHSVPYIQERFDEQVSVHQKYDVPANYFTNSGTGPYGWAPNADPVTKARFEIVKSTAEDAASAPLPDYESWDAVPWEIPVIELAFQTSSDITPSYVENYVSDRVLRVVNDTEIDGFANLRWDSSPLELRPREAGARESSVGYHFSSAFPLTELRVNAPGFITPGVNGAVSIAVLDENDNVIQTTNMTPGGSMSMIVPGASFTGREFQVVYTMSGTADVAGQVLAGVNSINVDASVVIPTQKAIDLEIANDGSVTFEEDLSGMSIYHTATFKNMNKIAYSSAGLLANPNPGVLEVIQEFRTPEDIELTRLVADGSADFATFQATMGIGISLDGINIIEQITSSGTFDGDLILDLTGQDIQTDRFYVHMLLSGSYGLMRSYTLEGVSLSPPLAGDFNNDGSVDAADYVVWRKTGIGGAQGYTDWRTNYGKSQAGSGGSSDGQLVPEPTGIVSLLVLAFAVFPATRLRQ